MLRENIYDLMSFIIVARERSFTKAAAQLGISQSALSHAMRGLEERLGFRLLMRTTRSVSPTDAGEQLIEILAPRIQEIEEGLENISQLREAPNGTIRIASSDFVTQYILWPRLKHFLRQYPVIQVEINDDYGFVDIVAERYDAGIRLGEVVAKDMIGVRISPDMSMVAVATPDYFVAHGVPQTPHDLTNHICINMRLSTLGGLYAWEFEENGREIKVRVEGQLTYNTIPPIVKAAREGFGIAYVPIQEVEQDLKNGTLQHVLKEYSPPYEGYYLYYPSRRQHPRAFQLFIDAMRYRD